MKMLLPIALLAAMLAGCGNNNEASHAGHDTMAVAEVQPAAIAEVHPVFTSLEGNVSTHIKTLFDHYIDIKNALVSGHPESAKQGAAALLKAARNFDKSLLPADQKPAYDKSTGMMRAAANRIAAAGDIEQQRVHFATLSGSAYELAKSFGAGKNMYHEYCPMALNDKGALWLSEKEEVRNPYYGDQMLECGTIEEVIRNQ